MHFRPSLYKVLLDLTYPSKVPSQADLLESGSSSPDITEKVVIADIKTSESEAVGIREKFPSVHGGGGLAVCASGPQSMTREAANAVARIQMSGRGSQLGGVGLHTENFSL